MTIKVKAIKCYNDAELNKTISLNDEFEVSKERAIQLLNHNVVEIIDIINNEDNEVDKSRSGRIKNERTNS